MENVGEVKVSVIMGVYNQWNESVLREAVQSILNQTLRDFEFIIYDDGSDEQAASYIRKLKELDDRIVLIGKEENHGLAFSLNSCIHCAKGTYIARMDADDISLPERLKEQYDFLENHKEFDWCGCNTEVFDEDGIWGTRKMPEIPTDMDYLPYSPFIHPTVMYRKSLFIDREAYRVSPETLRCEDYEIFMRLHQEGYKGYNLQKNLFLYRENKESFEKRQKNFRRNEARLRYRNFKNMGILFPFGWLYVIRPLAGIFIPPRCLAWLKRKETRLRYGREKVERTKAGCLQPDFTKETELF